MRLEIEGEGFGLARRHGMGWHASHTDTPKRMAILVSRYDHCLTDLLWRLDAGEVDAEVPLVVSNHPNLAPRVEAHGIPFHHLPVDNETKAEQESRILDLLSENRVDVVVLARYMQIISPEFVDAYSNSLINIHHSFLPAFAGADPYRRAHERGVKTIGATAHYVSEELDAGPHNPPGRRPRHPPRHGGRPRPPWPRDRAACPRPRRPAASRRPHPRGR